MMTASYIFYLATFFFFFYFCAAPRDLHSFPTRRSSDLGAVVLVLAVAVGAMARFHGSAPWHRSEEHTSELQSRPHLVCRLLLEKKNHMEAPATSRDSVVTYDHDANQPGMVRPSEESVLV